MGKDISTRNAESQPERFLGETEIEGDELVQFDMAKRTRVPDPEIYLGDWLELYEMKVGEAAKIAGCGQSYISNIVAGRRTDINVKFLLRLSEHFGVTINDFYRPLPARAELTTLKNLSPQAQANLLARQTRKR